MLKAVLPGSDTELLRNLRAAHSSAGAHQRPSAPSLCRVNPLYVRNAAGCKKVT